ncbi:hypothetical protein C8B47_19740, partial [filamentous cyanobacterium CCP4]
ERRYIGNQVQGFLPYWAIFLALYHLGSTLNTPTYKPPSLFQEALTNVLKAMNPVIDQNNHRVDN